jgi:hypothetical protein
MTISIALVVLAALALLFLVRVAKGQYIAPQGGENPADQIRFVDLEAFRNLIDPNEEDYLRRQLHPEDFRRIHRERLRAAADYILCAAHNAAVLLSLAEAARRSPDPAVAAMAEKLIENAIQLRLYAFQAIPKLYIAMFLPLQRLSPVRVADRYEQMTRQVVLLGLQYPTGSISGAL